LKNKQAPGLAMTRSLGDLVAKTVGVTHDPEIKSFPNLQPNIDKIVVIASDGLWDRIPNDEITRILISFYERKDPEGAATRLMQESAERWQREQGMIDDITIIVVFLNICNTSEGQKSQFLSVQP
jgi:serine/threonine protein phosphatase PrpC